MYDTKYTRKKRNKATYKSKHTEDVGNFYVRKPAMGDTPEQQYQRRRNWYGKKAPKDEGPLPLPFTGMIQF
jgi:hypothetical protein